MGNGKDKSKDKGNGKASKNGKEPDTLSKKDYEALLEPLQIELNGMARWLAHHGKRLVVLFEGRDTAGKGGAINAIADCLSPRQCHVVALSKPSDEEQGQWYFQRYVPHLPTAGQIALFEAVGQQESRRNTVRDARLQAHAAAGRQGKRAGAGRRDGGGGMNHTAEYGLRFVRLSIPARMVHDRSIP